MDRIVRNMLKKKAEVIQSKRTYGIEIELGHQEHEAVNEFQNSLTDGWRAVHDGSVSTDNGFELVSPILVGKSGAKDVQGMCSRLKDGGFYSDHISCGMHVHLGADEFRNKKVMVETDRKGFEAILDDTDRSVSKVYRIEKELMAATGMPAKRMAGETDHGPRAADGQVHTIGMVGNHQVAYRQQRTAYGGHQVTEKVVSIVDQADIQLIDAVAAKKRSLLRKSNPSKDAFREADERIKEATNVKKAALVNPKECIYVVELDKRSALDNLKNLLYFYLTFDDVFLHMLPRSRREGNSYCLPLREAFEPEQIEGVQTYRKFQEMWYKDPDFSSRPMGHYDDSRYYSVNLHCLWNRTNTIEIRSHGSTLNTSKILLWTALHQLIVDKVAKGEITIDHCRDMAAVENVGERARYMIELLELPEYMAEYIKRSLNHFSNITV